MATNKRPISSAHDTNARHEKVGVTDPSGPAWSYVTYLDAYRAHDFADERAFNLSLLEPRPGHRLLDVGCGTGEDVRALADLVGSSGFVVGLDLNHPMLAEAQGRTLNGSRVGYLQAGANTIPFESETFDGVRAERVLQHLQDPAHAFGEMVRVAKHGAVISSTDPDWQTLIVDSPDQEVTAAILAFKCGTVVNPWMGRTLPRLMREADLQDIGVRFLSSRHVEFRLADRLLGLSGAAKKAARAGMVTELEAERWLATLKDYSEQGKFFCSLTRLTVWGRKL